MMTLVQSHLGGQRTQTFPRHAKAGSPTPTAPRLSVVPALAIPLSLDQASAVSAELQVVARAQVVSAEGAAKFKSMLVYIQGGVSLHFGYPG